MRKSFAVLSRPLYFAPKSFLRQDEMDPSDRLRAFISDMNKWESECEMLTEQSDSGKMSDEDARSIAIDRYDKLFRTHCSQSASRRASDADGLHYSVPPEYQPNDELIDIVRARDDGSVEIDTTHKKRSPRRHRYVLVHEGGEWKILEKYRVYNDDDILFWPL